MLFSAPCSGNTQIKLDTSRTLGEPHAPVQGLSRPERPQLAQHHPYCKGYTASPVGKQLLGCRDMIHLARLAVIYVLFHPSLLYLVPLHHQPNRRW